eukprot:jgi/Ulvmu1/1212/UM109_0010.1
MDPHGVLGVSRSASKEEVKKAWRKAVRESHPDLHTNSPDHVQRKAGERFQAVQEAYDRITSGRAQAPRHTNHQTRSAYTAQHSSGQTDWAHVRNRYAYRRNTGYGFASWFNGSRAYTTPRAVRQQASLVLAAIAAMMTLDAVTNAAWDTSNDGRLYESVAKEAQRRLNSSRGRDDARHAEGHANPMPRPAATIVDSVHDGFFQSIQALTVVTAAIAAFALVAVVVQSAA